MKDNESATMLKKIGRSTGLVIIGVISVVSVAAWFTDALSKDVAQQIIGPAVGAAIAIIGVVVAARQDAAKSRHERAFALRQESLLNLAEHAAIPLQCFGAASDQTQPLNQSGQDMLKSLPKAVRGFCIVSLETIKKSCSASDQFVTEWIEIAKLRMQLDYHSKQIERLQAEIDRRKTSSSAANSSSQQTILRQIDNAWDTLNRYHDKRLKAHIAARLKTLKKV